MSRLALSLLGPFQALLDEQPVVGFRSDKTRALLAYLAAEMSRPHERQSLASLLWPDCPDATALTYLRSSLANLRHLLGDDLLGDDELDSPDMARRPFLLVSRTTIQLNPAASVWVDVTAFDALAAQASSQQALEGMAAIYRGSFLEGFMIGNLADDGGRFAEWLQFKRRHYQRKVSASLQQLAALALDQRNYAAAEEYAHRQLALELWDETAHRQLMTALAYGGKRGAALAQYAVCRTLLAQELGAEPSHETTELYLHIRAGHLSATVAPSDGAAAPPYLLRELAPFVARTRELTQLDAQLKQALGGAGQVLFVRGDAGSGKSALLYAFGRRAAQGGQAVAVLDGRCSNYRGNGDSFLPFREILQALASAGLADGPSAAGGVGALSLLMRPTPRARPAAPAALEGLYAQVTGLLQEAAQRRPLILLLDDLQWADSGTLGLLFHLGRRLGGSRILLVGAYRPEEVVALNAGSRHPLSAIVHELQRETGAAPVDLNRVEGRAFVDALLDVEPNRLDAAFRATLHRHTEGHALFTVELLRSLKESGALVQNDRGEWLQAAGPRWELLPPRVEAVIAERIERLPPLLRSLLEAASVQGETFSVEVLAACLAIDESQLVWMLSELVGRQHGLVYAELRQTLDPPGPQLLRYRFTHSLYQVYLYGRLDGVQRAWLHRQAGRTLETLYGSGAEALAAQLAWHYEQAGDAAQAVHYRQRAGDQAIDLSTSEEAIGHYLRGLALLETLPASPARAEQELALQVALAILFTFDGGWGGAQAHGAVLRACELAQEIGARPHLAKALFHLATSYVGSGEIAKAIDVGESLQLLARQAADRQAMAAADFVLGEANLFGCDLLSARRRLAQAVDLIERGDVQAMPPTLGVDLHVASLAWLASALWPLGLLDQAVACNRRSLACAQALDKPRTLAFALLPAGALFDLQCHDLPAAEVKVHAGLRLTIEKDFALFRHLAGVYQGYLRVWKGEAEAGIAQMQAELATWQAFGATSGVVQHYVLLAKAQEAACAVEGGLKTVDQALALVDRYDMRYNEAELWRIRGELLFQQRNVFDAASCFQHALAVAQSQQARLWELRALVSLCRLRQSQGRQAEVLPQLAALYAWFREGHATPDLQAAQALLARS